jgi:hypothetical protein
MTDSALDLDALRAVWTTTGKMSDREVRALAELVTLKERDVRGAAKRRSLANIAVSLVMGVVTGWAALHARWPWVDVGYGLCSITCLSAAAILGWKLRDWRAPDASLSTSAYYAALLGYYDREIRTLATVKYWYVAPLLAGIAIVGLATWLKTGSIAWSLGIGVGLTIPAWFVMRRDVEVRAIGELRAERARLAGWLRDMGVVPGTDIEETAGNANGA